MCVQGDDPLTCSFLSFLFFDWVGILWTQLSKVFKTCALGQQRPFSPLVSLQRQVVCLLLRPVFMCISGESLHCFVVGVIKSYVIATSDLWLFIHASNHTPSIAFRHLPPNSARFSYATEGALFISVQLSSDAVSALRKARALIRLWKQPSAQARR